MKTTMRMDSVDSYEVLRMPTVLESGYEIVDTAAMAMSQRFIACLNNERMTDVNLVGDDGVEVPACKFILGSASTNLQTLLYNGDEAKSYVRIENCREKALRALVEYSCSDMLNTNIWSDTEPVEIVEDMVSLAKLAEMYTLPNLKQQVTDVLCPCLDQLPSLACVAYNLVDTKTTPELHAASLTVLRRKPYQAFVKGPGGEIGGIACLSPEKLDTIFRDPEVNAEEIFLFQCLQEWKSTNMDNYSNTAQVCRRVAQHLDFSAMHASDIEDIVLPSGIVDSTSLVTGLMTVAKAAEKKGIHLRSARRMHPSNASTRSECSEPKPASKHTKHHGRRFKKPAPTLSLDSSHDYQSETRDDSPASPSSPASAITAPVSEMKAPHEHPLPLTPTRRSKVMSTFRSPKNLKSRASRFLGTLRGIKESATETKSVDEPVNLPPPPPPLPPIKPKKETKKEHKKEAKKEHKKGSKKEHKKEHKKDRKETKPREEDEDDDDESGSEKPVPASYSELSLGSAESAGSVGTDHVHLSITAE